MGCGSGFVVDALTRDGFEVVGIDKSAELIGVARDRYPHSRFDIADAARLPFADSTFDWYRSERMFLHIADPSRVLLEAHRILKAAGTIVLGDTDFGSLEVGSGNHSLDTAMFSALVNSLPNGRAGAHHSSWLATAGFHEISGETVPLVFDDFALAQALFLDLAAQAAIGSGLVDGDHASKWMGVLRERGAQGRFQLRCNFIVTTAVASTTGSDGPGAGDQQ